MKLPQADWCPFYNQMILVTFKKEAIVTFIVEEIITDLETIFIWVSSFLDTTTFLAIEFFYHIEADAYHIIRKLSTFNKTTVDFIPGWKPGTLEESSHCLTILSSICPIPLRRT